MVSLARVSLTAIVAFTVGIYLIAAMVPGALDTLFAVNTTGWDAGSAAVFALLPLLAIVGLLYLFLPRDSAE